MPQTTAIIGISPVGLQWICMLVVLLRHSDPTLPELARRCLQYLSHSAGETAVPSSSVRARPRTPRRALEF